MRVKKTVNCWWFTNGTTWGRNALCLPASAWWLLFAPKAQGYCKKLCQFGAEVITKKRWIDPGLYSFQRLERKQLDIYFIDGQLLLPVHLEGQIWSVDTHTWESAPPLHAHSCTDTCAHYNMHTLIHMHTMKSTCRCTQRTLLCICSLTSQGKVSPSVFFPLNEAF